LPTIFLSGDDISFFNMRFCHFGEFSDKKPVLKDGVLGQPPRGNKKAASLTTRNGLIFGEPCRDRTDNLLIKSRLGVTVRQYFIYLFHEAFKISLVKVGAIYFR